MMNLVARLRQQHSGGRRALGMVVRISDDCVEFGFWCGCVDPAGEAQQWLLLPGMDRLLRLSVNKSAVRSRQVGSGKVGASKQ